MAEKGEKRYLAGCSLPKEDSMSQLVELVGKKVLNVGFLSKNDYPRLEGGLCIDYEYGKQTKRFVLGFTELGMWVEWHGRLGEPTPDEELIKKVLAFVEDTGLGDIVDVKTSPKKLKYTFINDEEVSICLSINELKLIAKKLPEILDIFVSEITDADLDMLLELLQEYVYSDNDGIKI